MSWDSFIDSLHFDEKGLIPVAIMDAGLDKLITICFMNKKALKKTMQSRLVHSVLRSRGIVQQHGEWSGRIQRVEEIRINPTNSVLEVRVIQSEVKGHQGYFFTQFYRAYNPGQDIWYICDPESYYSPRSSWKSK